MVRLPPPGVGLSGRLVLLILAPTSSVMPLRDLAFDYRMYLPSAAVVAAAVLGGYGGLQAAARRGWLSGRQAGWAGALVAAAAAVWLGAATYRRNVDYRSRLALWADTVQKAPHNGRALNNLGYALLQQGELEAAIRCLRIAAVVARLLGGAGQSG